LNPTLPNPLDFWTLVKIICRTEPDLIHTWMYHADLLGGVAGRVVSTPPVLWSLRQSNFDTGKISYSTLLIVQLCAWLSDWIPERIISCSRTGKDVHVEKGYPEEKVEVIPNGFDTEKFQPDDNLQEEFYDELGLGPEDFLIGLVARFHSQKDHETFVRAAGILNERYPNVRFLLCGQGTTRENEVLLGWIRDEGLEDRFHLLGERRDVRPVYCALDLLTSSSAYGEGFPNVLGEGMACEVPCVATDIGDSAMILGETGTVVPPEDPEALADGWEEYIQMEAEERRKQGRRARRRIEQNFSIEVVRTRFENLYEDLMRSGQ
jgi:glycosyltransferase involved in cell wall biosynthesis